MKTKTKKKKIIIDTVETPQSSPNPPHESLTFNAFVEGLKGGQAILVWNDKESQVVRYMASGTSTQCLGLLSYAQLMIGKKITIEGGK